MYLCHGYYLAITGKPLVNEEVQAWRYGPVLPILYYAIRHFGDIPVRGQINEGLNKDSPPLIPAQHKLIDAVYEIYGDYDAIDLSEMTHQSNTPWSQVWARKKKNAPIPNDMIASSFKELLGEQHAS